ncbi:MAG: hypothetical protein P8P30_02060 [Rickettsiales bacterium]|nr:hypothetical protein [Rickettsiales bacterium]
MAKNIVLPIGFVVFCIIGFMWLTIKPATDPLAEKLGYEVEKMVANVATATAVSSTVALTADDLAGQDEGIEIWLDGLNHGHNINLLTALADQQLLAAGSCHLGDLQRFKALIKYVAINIVVAELGLPNYTHSNIRYDIHDWICNAEKSACPIGGVIWREALDRIFPKMAFSVVGCEN